jgi:hypothetical protein
VFGIRDSLIVDFRASSAEPRPTAGRSRRDLTRASFDIVLRPDGSDR